MTSPTWHERWRELDAKATEGPWGKYDAERSDGSGREVFIQPTWAKAEFSDIVCRDMLRGDAHLIAFLRNTAAEVAEVIECLLAYKGNCCKEHGTYPCGCDLTEPLDDALDALDRRVKELQGTTVSESEKGESK